MLTKADALACYFFFTQTSFVVSEASKYVNANLTIDGTCDPIAVNVKECKYLPND